MEFSGVVLGLHPAFEAIPGKQNEQVDAFEAGRLGHAQYLIVNEVVAPAVNEVLALEDHNPAWFNHAGELVERGFIMLPQFGDGAIATVLLAHYVFFRFLVVGNDEGRIEHQRLYARAG